MPSSFTHYWSESTPFDDDDLFIHTAGNRFVSAGVSTGDTVFGISVRRGTPILVGRLIASSPPVGFEEARELLPYEPWEADEHVIAVDGSASTQSSKRVIPIDVLRQLRFESPSGITALKWVSDTRLDQQTFRGVRRLTPESADLLESLIDDEFDDLPQLEDVLEILSSEVEDSKALSRSERLARLESAPRQPEVFEVLTTAFQRNPDVIAEVLFRANGICEKCKNPAPFARRSDGTPYLEVHHWTPLSEGGEDTVDNAGALCPNCHREAHYG